MAQNTPGGAGRASSIITSTESSDAVYSFKLLEALRSGDVARIMPFLTASVSQTTSVPASILYAASQSSSPVPRPPSRGLSRVGTAASIRSATRKGSLDTSARNTVTAGKDSEEADQKTLVKSELASPLHLAIRCAEYPTIEFVLSSKHTDVNALDSDTWSTPLHIASSMGRADVVRLLLGQKDIDDTIRNRQGKEALDIAERPEIAQIIQVSRAEYNDRYLLTLSEYISSVPDSPARLVSLLSQPRYRVLDLNSQDLSTGTTLLHEATRRKDMRMVELAVRRGADVLARDRKGKSVIDVAKDEKIKAYLRQFTSADAARRAQAAPGKAPSLKGYMQKWTNMAQGYKTRWFVLDNGVLSYYRTQEDEGKLSRGAINMRFATVKADGNDKHRFEVASTQHGSKGPKIYIRGSHPVERARWIHALEQNIEFYRQEREQRLNSGRSDAHRPVPSRSGSIDILSAGQRQSGLLSVDTAGNTTMTMGKSFESPRAASLGASSAQQRSSTSHTPSVVSNSPSEDQDADEPDAEADGEEGDEAMIGDAFSKTVQTPHEDRYHLLTTSIHTQLGMVHQLLHSIKPPPATSPVDGGSSAADSQLMDAVKQSLKTLEEMVKEYQGIVDEREKYLVKRFEQEVQAKHLWEQNMQELAKQHAEMDAALRQAAVEAEHRRRTLRTVRESIASSSSPPFSPPTSPPAPTATATSSPPPKKNALDDVLQTPGSTIVSRREGALPSALTSLRLESPNNTLASPSGSLRQASSAAALDEIFSEADTEMDGDDDFFDAIETGNLPGLKVETPLDRAGEQEWPRTIDINNLNLDSFTPYTHLRTTMPLADDDRPPVSLWAILKGSIGKDLTRISFPVYFNEPTSMLQRMAEDMEFSECLDAAAAQEDSTKRIAFVAAFAMSNYSSTIGRIAKPFNPLLGETFEYARLDKHYRYMSEQVSHHPPISACIAESPTWNYFGCVDAKSKFLGKSFEIRPTGVAHVDLKLPQEWAPNYPPDVQVGFVKEHYSWNKVTTSVSGFVLGSPTIDHFGDMVVTNHRTGDRCVLTFKQRGWRGSNAYEIKGAVYDASGNLAWDIAGRWNGQLVARKVGVGRGELQPDAKVPGNEDGKDGPSASNPEYLLLWRNSEKRRAPFNLTPFAITLNHLPSGLQPYLPPTDCRLRPDQHAFEKGQFEHANLLKGWLEDHQRETRRKRENGELPPHRPRWFTRRTEPDTGESYWEPSYVVEGLDAGEKSAKKLEYWLERERVGSFRKQGKDTHWKEVDEIFPQPVDEED